MSNNTPRKSAQYQSFGSSAPLGADRRSARKPRSRFSPEYEVLLQRLIALRKGAGLTQGAMALALGKTQSHISMCENRERELSIIDLWKWCMATGTNWSDFVRELEEEITPKIECKQD